MKLLIGLAVRDRLFGKAMQRVLPSFDSLRTEFEKIELIDQIHNAILVGLTDDRESTYFEETPNNKGNFQVLMGCPQTANDEELKQAVFERVKRAVMACPFSTPDKAGFERLLQRWADANFAN
jgi:hypothetical protein